MLSVNTYAKCKPHGYLLSSLFVLLIGALEMLRGTTMTTASKEANLSRESDLRGTERPLLGVNLEKPVSSVVVSVPPIRGMRNEEDDYIWLDSKMPDLC